MTDSGRKSSFWSSLPGVLTALAGLIGAVAALLTALYTTGLIGHRPDIPLEAPAVSGSPSNPGRAPAPSSLGSTPAGHAALDRTQANAVARSALLAYRSRDVIALASVACAQNKQILSELAAQGEAPPRYASIFSGWRWSGVQSWDGHAPLQARYRHYVGAARDEYQAHVKFGELGPDEVLTVTLIWQSGVWCFDDVNSPSASSFAKGANEFRVVKEAY